MGARGRKSLAEQGIHPFDHFLTYVDQRGSSECWPWLGGISKGYGHFRAGEWQGNAHLFAYRMWVGPVPTGLVLDHQCHTAAVRLGECAGGESCQHRRCVNPRHLEPVEFAENVRRGANAAGRQTHCKRGHEFTGDNLRVTIPGGVRICRACEHIRVAAYRQRQELRVAS